MNRIFALALMFGVGCATAKDYCPRMPEPKAEADAWYMPEPAFTKQAAKQSLSSTQSERRQTLARGCIGSLRSICLDSRSVCKDE
jgi:hypothetical protein